MTRVSPTTEYRIRRINAIDTPDALYIVEKTAAVFQHYADAKAYADKLNNPEASNDAAIQEKTP